MNKLITEKEARKLAAAGQDPRGEPGVILTPSARDFFASQEKQSSGGTAHKTGGATLEKASKEPIIPDYEFRWTPGSDPKTPAEIERFFNSPAIQTLKERICDMGRRMWQKNYTDGNGGNLTIRVGDNLVLCTPTLVSKGFMTPAHICLVDLEGKQLAGNYKRTSEVMTHIGIMKRQPAAKACCHAHPPHGTAYAVAKVRPPTCLIPEAEVFLGVIGASEYRTPGSPENAQVVGEAAIKHQSVLMENHGVITWGKDIEDAYWKMENTDAYCQTILLASMLGRELEPISGDQAKDLIGIRKQLGMDDYRESWKECELCDNLEFRPGFFSKAKDTKALESPSTQPDPEAEALVKVLSEEIMKRLGS